MLVRTNPSSKKKPAVQDIFPPPPSITTPIDETGPRCSSQTSLSTTDDDEEKVLDTPTFDVAPATVNHTHGNQDVCVPPLLPLQPIELETLPVKKWSLNPTTTLVRSELLRTFEQVDTELELELDLKRSQMIQSLNTRPRHVF
jgi:hypothetical protein